MRLGVRRRVFWVAIAGFLSGGLGACGSVDFDAADGAVVDASVFDEVPADGTLSVSGLVRKDVKTGYTPGDPYRTIDTRIEDYAGDVFIARCLEDSGLTFSVRQFDWEDPAASQFFMPSLQPAFTIEQAEKYGYHSRPRSSSEQKYFDVLVKIQNLDDDPQLASAWDACDNKRIVTEPFLTYRTVTDLPSYVAGIDQLPDVRAAADKWRECMGDLGIPDLPEYPAVAESLRKKFFLDSDPASLGNSETAPSLEEIQVAVHDAKCRESSNYEQLVYDAEWVAEEALIAKNFDEYSARLDAISQGTQAYKDYIEEYGR